MPCPTQPDDEPMVDGGDPACWVHPIDDAPTAPASPMHPANLQTLIAAAIHSGPIWTTSSDDLHVNLLRFDAGQGVAEHLNAEVDVLIIGVAGEGVLTIDDRTFPLIAGTILIVPKGCRRSIHALSDGLAYLTNRRTRAGLWPQVAP